MNVIARIGRRIAAARKWIVGVAVFVPALIWFAFFDKSD